MTGGEVAIEAVDQGRKERQYRVRIQLALPAGAVIVGPDHPGNAAHEDVYVAIRNAFRAARRQLELQLRADPQGAPR
jgi:ribosome-associated translation inhibitor RaiA